MTDPTLRPKALRSLIEQSPCTVLSTTTDSAASYGEPPEHLVLTVDERDEIVAYIESLERR